MNLLDDVYIGSYTDNQKVPGVYDLIPKDMTVAKINVPLVNPSFILIRNNFMYAVEEVNNGRINVIDSQHKLIKTILSYGDGPCHLSMNEIGNRLVVTNYSNSTVVMYGLKQGFPDVVKSYIKHEGSSVNPDRQSCPHPHSSIFSYDNRILFVADLGTDIVYYYTVNYQGPDSLICEKQKCIKITGSGPRHLARGQPSQQLLYLTCQLDSTIRVLSYASGKLQLISTYKVSTNPQNYPSQVVYRQNMAWIANRGDDNIILFDATVPGVLKQILRFKVGKWPRHFKISKQGRIYVACQNGNAVQIYQYVNGKIMSIGSIKINTPSCINFQQN